MNDHGSGVDPLAVRLNLGQQVDWELLSYIVVYKQRQDHLGQGWPPLVFSDHLEIEGSSEAIRKWGWHTKI